MDKSTKALLTLAIMKLNYVSELNPDSILNMFDKNLFFGQYEDHDEFAEDIQELISDLEGMDHIYTSYSDLVDIKHRVFVRMNSLKGAYKEITDSFVDIKDKYIKIFILETLIAYKCLILLIGKGVINKETIYNFDKAKFTHLKLIAGHAIEYGSKGKISVLNKAALLEYETKANEFISFIISL